MFRKMAIGFVSSVLLATAAVGAQVQAQYWSVTGSTGIVDEASISKVAFNDVGSAFFKSGATGTIQLRYPVIPSGELEKVKAGESEGFFCLDVIYKDTGPGARIVVKLKSADGESVVTHVTFDSDTVAPTGTRYRTNVTDGPLCGFRDEDGSPIISFRTIERAYFVEVVLTKTRAGAEPGVRVIKILDSQWYD